MNIRLLFPSILALALVGCPGGSPSATDPSPAPSASAMPANIVSAVPTAFPSVVALSYLAPPPWLAPTDVEARIQAAKLDKLTAEGQAFHIHAHLDVFYQGHPVTVPAGIGIDPKGAFISPLHTHDESGLLHVEANGPLNITVGQFFSEWNVALTNATATVDGQANSAPAAIVLHDHQEIAIVFGTPPAVIPAAYVGP